MCKSGKVSVQGIKVKPSHQVRVSDRIQVSKNGYLFQFEVVVLLKKRVGAPIAAKAYLDHTPEAELRKYDDWFVGKASSERRQRGAGRPTKKERRELDQFKGDYYFND